MDIDTFVSQTNGAHVDEDGYYGAQCWDLVAKYARVVVGCPSFPTGSGGAEGLYRIFADPIPQYFDRVYGNYKKGDVIVWSASFSPPYGHTALCLGFDGTTLTILEQNGNNPGGVSYIKQRSLVGVSGALRPKEREEMKVDSNNLKYLYMGIYGQDPNVAVSPTDPEIGQDYADTTERILDYANKNDLAYWQYKPVAEAKIATLTEELNDSTVKFEELLKADQLKDQRIADLQKQVPSSTEVEQPVVSPVPAGKSLWQVIADFFSQFKKG